MGEILSKVLTLCYCKMQTTLDFTKRPCHKTWSLHMLLQPDNSLFSIHFYKDVIGCAVYCCKLCNCIDVY